MQLKKVKTYPVNQKSFDSISKIYVGLPKHLQEQVFWVEKKYRTNPLSLQGHRFDIVVEYKSKKVLAYDSIKLPHLYIEKICKDIKIKFPNLSIPEIVFGEFNKIYTRCYSNEVEYQEAPFIDIWDSEFDTSMPWKKIELHYSSQLSQTQ